MGNSVATNLPPIAEFLMYKEANSNNFGANVYCSVERTDVIHISNISFYYSLF